MDRILATHISVAIVSLTLAFLAWRTPDAVSSREKPIMIPGNPESLSAISWEETQWQVRLEKQDLDDDDIKVTVTKKNSDEQAKVFPGSKSAKDLFSKLAPLEAGRELGNVPNDRLAALGINEEASILELQFTGAKHQVRFGGSTFGSGDLYAMGPDDRVFLVPAAKIGSLRHGAATLLDRRAVGLERTDFERITLVFGGITRDLLQRNAEDEHTAFFADPAEPDVKLEKISAWIGRLLRVRIVEANQPFESSPATFRIKFYKSDTEVAEVAVWEGQERVAPAFSSRFGGGVTIAKANADSLIRELREVANEAH